MTTLKSSEIKFNKNGYEIRADILKMAKELMIEDFHAQFQSWKLFYRKDAPEFPELDKILETAEKMYAFVNKTK
jgi:hypothetical protein